MGPGALSEILKAIEQDLDPQLLVGFNTSDDACVYQLRDDLAVIQTVDFFPPIVDDPFLYGQVAAANALSDIYAMGASPALALNILCVPSCLSQAEVGAIIAGGASKVREAGAVIAGGHSVEDAEPKYGLCVSAFVHPARIWSNAGVQAGDALVLTKPLGNGILATAAKNDKITQEAFLPAVQAMATLNKYACEAASACRVHACTDVTGFGLLGHAYEMAAASGVTLMLEAEAFPLLDGAYDLAAAGTVPGGAKRNAEYTARHVCFAPSVKQPLRDILHDPQTSGGLLLAVPAQEVPQLLANLTAAGVTGHVVGHAHDRKSALHWLEIG